MRVSLPKLGNIIRSIVALTVPLGGDPLLNMLLLGMPLYPGDSDAVRSPLRNSSSKGMPKMPIIGELPRLGRVAGGALDDFLGSFDNRQVVHTHMNRVESNGSFYHRTEFRSGAGSSGTSNRRMCLASVIALRALHESFFERGEGVSPARIENPQSGSTPLKGGGYGSSTVGKDVGVVRGVAFNSRQRGECEGVMVVSRCPVKELPGREAEVLCLQRGVK